MKLLQLTIALTFLLFLSACSTKSTESTQTITPITLTKEQQQIKTNLETVMAQLAQKDIASLSPDLQEKRNLMLTHLQEYIQKGNFPENYDYHQNLSPFVEADDKICPIGYLIQQTAGSHLLSEIKAFYQYAVNPQMESPELLDWVATSGLTPDECALIKPVTSFSADLKAPLVQPQP